MKETGALLIFLFLSAIITFLVILKVIFFFKDFNEEKKYIKTEIGRAYDKGELLYWKKELAIHKLCLIPFVNRKRALRIYRFFTNNRHNKNADGKFRAVRVLAPSILGMAASLIYLCVASWAWFSSTKSSDVSNIISSNYDLKIISVFDENGDEVLADGKYFLNKDKLYEIKLKSGGSDMSSGFCKITLSSGEVYYTAPIFANTDFEFSITPKTDGEVTFECRWGTLALSGVKIISNGENINN